jgi:hypothetical protein
MTEERRIDVLTRSQALLCLSLLAPALCLSQAPTKSPGHHETEAEALVLRLTHQVLDAELRSDQAAMNRLFTDNYSHTHQSGVVQNKAEFIASFVPGAQKYKIAEISDVQVRHFGTSAIVNGHENINDHHYLFSCFWVLEQANWRMAAWITSPALKSEATQEHSK